MTVAVACARSMNARFRGGIWLIALVALVGCTHVVRPPNGTPPTISTPTPTAPGRYAAQPGRGADTIAELRAAPAPAQPEFTDSQSPAGDEHVLAAKGFVHIGDGYYAGVDASARAWLLQQGREVGADKALVYTGGDNASLHVVYFVRFKLPFGASFRDLTAEERDNLGMTGVRIGAVIGGSPAAEANLRDGDFVLKFNGDPIRDRAEFQQLLRAHMGKRVTLTISRDGTVMPRLLRLGALASEVGTQK